MNFVLDMNLAPRWCQEFTNRGHQAAHWTQVGSPDAPDTELMRWARDNDHVVFTHDLDFGTLLALTHAAGPSVIQVRSAEPLPESVGEQLFRATQQYGDELDHGALVTVDPARSRVRILPIRRSG